MNPAPIYLDHNATTPLDPEVLDAMRPYFLTAGNAESRHAFGRSARRAWELSKETVAQILGADPAEVIFTSGGTEANNLAVFGLAGAESHRGMLSPARSNTRRSLSQWPGLKQPALPWTECRSTAKDSPMYREWPGHSATTRGLPP